MPTNAFDVFVQGMQQQSANAQDMGRLQLQVALSQWEQKKRAEEAVLADARDLDRQLTVAKENARLNAEAQRKAKSDARDLQVENMVFELARDKARNDFEIARDKSKSREGEARLARERKTRSEMAAANVLDLRKTATDMRESAINDLATVGQRARSPEAAMEATRNLLQTGSITRDQAAVLGGLASKGNIDSFQSQLDTYAKAATRWFGGDTDKSTAIRNALASSVENQAQQLKQAAIVNMQLVDNSIRDYERQAAEEGRYILPEHRALLEPAKPTGPAGSQTPAPQSEADRFKAMLGGSTANPAPTQSVAAQQQVPTLAQITTMGGSNPNQGIAGIGPRDLEYPDGSPTPLLATSTAATLRNSAAYTSPMQALQMAAGIASGGFYKPEIQPTPVQGSNLASALTQYIAAVNHGDTATAQQIGSAIEEFRSKFSGGKHEPINLQNASQALAVLQQKQSMAMQ